MEKHQVFNLLSLKNAHFFWFHLFAQTFLPIRVIALHILRKKQQWRQKKEKGAFFNIFLWQVAFMQHFFKLHAQHYSQFVFFPSPKKENLRLNSIFEGLFSTPFTVLQTSNFNKTKQPKQLLKKFRKSYQQSLISPFLPLLLSI